MSDPIDAPHHPRLEFSPNRHTYHLDGVKLPSVSRILRVTGIAPDLSHIPPDVLRRAADRGRAVHACVEHWDDITRDDWTPRTTPYLIAYQRFLDDTGFEPMYHEVKIASVVHKYAGRLDMVGWLWGKRTLIDLKATKNVHPKIRWQLWAYRIGWNEMHPDQPIQEGFGLQVTRSGRYDLVPGKGMKLEYRARWLDAVDRYYRMEEEGHGEGAAE